MHSFAAFIPSLESYSCKICESQNIGSTCISNSKVQYLYLRINYPSKRNVDFKHFTYLTTYLAVYLPTSLFISLSIYLYVFIYPCMYVRRFVSLPIRQKKASQYFNPSSAVMITTSSSCISWWSFPTSVITTHNWWFNGTIMYLNSV